MTRATRVSYVLAAAVAVVAVAPAREPAPDLPPVPKFVIAPSPIGLSGDVRPGQYLGVVSPRAAWLGLETGEAEVWVHPLKLVSGLHLDFRIPDYDEPVRGADVARTVEVRPELTTVTYAHATFTARQHVLAPLDRPGVLVLLDIDAVRPIEVIVSFREVFQYAWPGAFGGQYAAWRPDLRAFLFSESLRLRNAYLGSPWATAGTDHPAHALPDAPSVFRIPVDPARARREFLPIAIVAGTQPREALADEYRRLIADAERLYRDRVAHAARLRDEAVRLDTPEDRIDLAFEWAKVNLDEQRVCNPDLGCGPVAGWGPSGQGARPGFGWFFGGDAAINSLAMSSAGLREPVAEGLRFFAKYQRADGKIPHEISQAAGQLPWFDRFPYAYYHADTTPYWIVAVWQHWRATADAALVDEIWPAIRKAWAWCLTTETDGDGIIENTAGGLGAIEVGAIGEQIHQDIYLAAVWLQATAAMAEMAGARGDTALAEEARSIGENGRRTLNERYWIEPAGHHAFGLLASGAVNDALTVWPATAAAFGLLEPARARRTLTSLAGHRIAADWGARMLAVDHPLYDPLHYNMGAVWPFVTGFVARGHYQYGRPWAGFPLVDALGQLTFDFARGRHAELLSGAFYRPLDTAVPHQFFASSMLATPLLRGVIGWSADAPRRRARLAPQVPPSWARTVVRGLPAGDSRVHMTLDHAAGSQTATLSGEGAPIDLEFVPAVPPGAREVRTRVSQAASTPPRDDHAGEPSVFVRLQGAPVVVTTTWRGGYAVDPPRVDLTPGQRRRGLRVLDVVAEADAVRVELEAPEGGEAEFSAHGPRPASVEGGELVAWAGTAGRVWVRFPASDGIPFSRATVRLRER